MDKAKTLEVLRGMKFMQRKEEAKRQLLHPSAGNSGASGGGSSAVGQDRGGGKSRVTVLYDDAFPARAYGMSRRRFTETVSDGGTSSIAAELGNADVSLRDGAVEPKAFQKDAGLSPTSAYAAPEDSDVTSGDEVEDLWGSVDEEADANDPTAAPRTRRQGGEKGRACREDHDQHVRGDGRFTVKSSLRAPKVVWQAICEEDGRVPAAPSPAPHRTSEPAFLLLFAPAAFQSKSNMEQQAQLTAGEQQQEQSAADMATRSRSANEDTFDSVRQAAVVMFKQRTKDLTRLVQVETQCRTIEAELSQAQACVTRLVAQQASLEALLEEEQQRSRQRESRLQELHSALLQLDEEQQRSSQLQHSAEVAIGAATAFIQNFTNADGRLFQLLTMASARTSGRSAVELQRRLMDVQQVLSAAETHRQDLVCLPSFARAAEVSTSEDTHNSAPPPFAAAVAADACATRVSHALQEWVVKMDWAQHRELADAVQIMQQLAAWLSTEGSTQEEAHEAAAVRDASFGSELRWLALLSGAEDAVTEEHWFGSPSLRFETLEAGSQSCGVAEVGAQDDRLRGALQSDEFHMEVAGSAVPSSEAVHRVLQHDLLAPLQAILTYNAQLVAVCAQHHLQLPEDAPSHAASVAATQQRWVCFHAAWQQWREDVLKAQAAADAATDAEAELGAARAALLALRENCEEQSRHYASRTEEVARLKETELSDYAAAWSRGVRTLQAQRNSFCAIFNTIASLKEEASALATTLNDGSQRHAQETHARDVALAERQEQLAATRQRVGVAKARAAELEAECAEAQRVQQLVRGQHAALLSCASARTPPLSSAAGNDGVALESQTVSMASGERSVIKCATSVALVLLQSTTAWYPAHTAWTERLVELSSEVDGVAAAGDSGGLLTASVSQFFDSLMNGCRDGEVADSEGGRELALDAAAVRLAIQDTSAGLRLPSDLFVGDVIDAEFAAQMPFLQTLCEAEETVRVSVEEHRAFMREAAAEMSLLRREAATVEG